MVSLTLMAACAAAARGNGNKKQATAAARKGTLAEVSGMRIMGSLLSLVARRAARSIPGVADGLAQSCSHRMSAVLALSRTRHVIVERGGGRRRIGADARDGMAVCGGLGGAGGG